MKTIYLAGGCFWGVQKFFDQFDGVASTQEKKAGARLAVKLEPLENFFTAEEYHQKYLVKNIGACYRYDSVACCNNTLKVPGTVISLSSS